MRIFHVSEEANIETFHPRVPMRDDLDKAVGLVWAINENCLPNFLTPRNCPRVTYHIGEKTTKSDIDKFFSSSKINHTVVIEQKWFKPMLDATLYLYEFDISDFELQDVIAGYYVSKVKQTPIKKHKIDNLFDELFKRNVEIRMVDNLWEINEKIQNSTLNWSMCRMAYAQPRK